MMAVATRPRPSASLTPFLAIAVAPSCAGGDSFRRAGHERGIHGPPDVGKVLQLGVGEPVEEDLSYLLEMGAVRLLEPGGARTGQHDLETSGIVLPPLPLDEPFALKVVDQARQAARAHEDLSRERRHRQTTVGAEPQLDEHVIVAPREPVPPLELGIREAGEPGAGSEESLPGGELPRREPVGGASGPSSHKGIVTHLDVCVYK